MMMLIQDLILEYNTMSVNISPHGLLVMKGSTELWEFSFKIFNYVFIYLFIVCGGGHVCMP